MKSIKLYLDPVDELHLPYAHFPMLRGLAYRLIERGDAALAAELHDRRFQDKRPFKFFCFSDVGGRYVNNGEHLIYKRRIIWELRSADDRVIDAAARAVCADPSAQIGGTRCEIVSYDICEKRFCRNELTFTLRPPQKRAHPQDCISYLNTPITVYRTDPTGYRHYYQPADDAFISGVVKNIKNKFEMFYEKPLPCGVIFLCRHAADKDKCITRPNRLSDHPEQEKKKGFSVEAWYGTYYLKADPQILNFIYHTGLGANNSTGFGLFTDGSKEESY